MLIEIQEIFERKQPPSYTAIVIVLSTVWSCTQLAWAVQNANVTPKLRALGVSEEAIPIIWIAGPTSGLLVQPAVGYISDTLLENRRKPVCYVAIAAICMSLVAFGFATTVTGTIICFWCLDLSINALMDPCRALLANLLPDVATQTQATFAFVTTGTIARFLGYLVGSFSTDGDSALRMHIVFCAAAVYVAIIGVLAVLWLPEAPIRKPSGSNPFTEAAAGLTLVAESRVLRLAFLAQLLSYIAWSATFMFGSDWLAQYAFDGGDDATSSQFTYALSMANLTLAGMSALSVCLSLVLSGLPVAPLWTVALLSMSLCLGFLGFATLMGWHTFWLAVPFILLGFTWVCSEAIPWLMVAEEISFNPAFEGYGGRVVAAFNISQCIPGLIAAVAFGPLQGLTHSLAPLLILGAVSVAIAAVLAWFTGQQLGEMGYDKVGEQGGTTPAHEEKGSKDP